MKPYITKSLGALSLALAVSAAQAGVMIDETRPANGNSEISVELVNGFITVRGWERPEFHISGTLSDKAEGFELETDDEELRFEEELNRRDDCFGQADNCQSTDQGVNLTLEMPRNARLRLEGANLKADLSGLERNTEVEVINGEIIASNLKGVVELQVINGDIRVSALEGRVSLETVNGNITDTNSSGSRGDYQTVNGNINSNTTASRVHLDNVNGEIALLLGNIDELEASTVGGGIKVKATLNARAEVELSSVQGSIELALPESTSANFEVSASVGGRIDNRLNSNTAMLRGRFSNSSDLDFSLNGGDADVEVSTVSGRITLCVAGAGTAPGC
jgi:DUF4097 and DUF4098 domain-containing protein YvlB